MLSASNILDDVSKYSKRGTAFNGIRDRNCNVCVCVCSRLADLMEQHQEELATIESIDSGAVYTLALKTHIGMSIQTFRYFAGWCDKIQVCVCVFHLNILWPLV